MVYGTLYRNHKLNLICIQGPCLWYNTYSGRVLGAFLIALLTIWLLHPYSNISYNKIIIFVMQKWCTNGKRATGKQLHAHTSGSQSFAVKRDNFVSHVGLLCLY